MSCLKGGFHHIRMNPSRKYMFSVIMYLLINLCPIVSSHQYYDAVLSEAGTFPVTLPSYQVRWLLSCAMKCSRWIQCSHFYHRTEVVNGNSTQHCQLLASNITNTGGQLLYRKVRIELFEFVCNANRPRCYCTSRVGVSAFRK